MKFLLFLSALFFSISIFASNKPKQYKLEIELSIDGKKVSQPMLHVIEGEKGHIVTDTKKYKRYFEVIASEGEINGHKGILMKFDLGMIMKDGSYKYDYKPVILSKNGEEAEITIGADDGTEKMSLKVTAHRSAI